MGTNQEENKFIVYDLVEVATKLTSLIGTKHQVRIWKKKEHPFFASLIDISKNTLSFDLKKEIPYSLIADEYLFVNFCFNSLDYFLKAKIIANDKEQLKLFPEGKIYKAERRENERLLTYPHMQVYAYLSVDNKLNDLDGESNNQNVLSFKRVEEKDKKKLRDFLSLSERENLPEKFQTEHIDNDDLDINLQGFRVMDLSPSGLSFCVNLDSEAPYFLEDEKKEWEIYLLFNEKSYILPGANIMYNVDFVNPQTSVVPMKKIGMKFLAPLDLKSQIYDYIDESGNTSELEKEFEQFIKD